MRQWICSDEGLTLETSAFQSLYGDQFTLSTPLINQIFIYCQAEQLYALHGFDTSSIYTHSRELRGNTTKHDS